jgi:hypothetical protein
VTDQFIPGIYNYCDRWCERCPLTARCRVFAMEEERKLGDDYYAAFWKTFDDLTEQESEEWTEESFADADGEAESFLNDAENWEDGDEDDSDELELAVDRDPIVSLAMDYGMQVHRWLLQHIPENEEAATDRPQAGAEQIGREEALEVLHWYVHQIGVKLSRAMPGVQELVEELDMTDDEEETEDEVGGALVNAAQQDRDGSAKVALIGIERSLGAWTILRDDFPDHHETIRSFQRSLARLRRMIDERIPGARVFQRPGFEFEV